MNSSTTGRSRWLAYTACALILVIATTWIGILSWQRGRSRALAERAERKLAQDQESAFELARESWLTAKTSEARLAVQNTAARLLFTLPGHEDAVVQASFSPDGRR